MGISIGWINSCGIRKGRDSSALKVFVMGQNIYIWVLGQSCGGCRGG